MRAVGNHRRARTISLALVAGLLAFETALVLGAGAVGIPGLVLYRVTGATPVAQPTGGETVVSKLAEAARTLNAKPAAAPANKPIRLTGLAEIPWQREPAPKEEKPKVFAQTTAATDALPWDAVEPVPFTPNGVTAAAAPRAAPPPPAKPVHAAPKIELPAPAAVKAWVKAKASKLKGEDRTRPIYHFEFWLEAPAAITQRLVSVAYDFNTPAILPQSQVSREDKTGFRVRVGGLACADNVTITLRFDDGSSEEVAVDGCRLVS